MGEGCDGDGIWVSNYEDLGFAILYGIILDYIGFYGIIWDFMGEQS